MCSKESVAWSALGFIFRSCFSGGQRWWTPCAICLTELSSSFHFSHFVSSAGPCFCSLCPQRWHTDRSTGNFIKTSWRVRVVESSKLLEMRLSGQLEAEWRSSGYGSVIIFYSVKWLHCTFWIGRTEKASWNPLKHYHASLIGANERNNQSERDKI